MIKQKIREGLVALSTSAFAEERQHTKLRTRNKMKQEKGITLIALVVTIVVLLILAGISIQTLFGNDGIFNTAQSAVSEYEKQVVADKFNVHILAWKTDKILGKSNNISDLWQKLQDGGIIKNKEADVSAPISTSKGTIYEVSTTDGYVVEVIEDEKADVRVGEIYKADKMPPRVTGVETSKTTSSIHVEIKVQRLNEGKITYSYKKQEETTYKELKTSKDLTADFTGLEQNVVYNIQIVANNKNGKSNTETIHVLTGSLKSGTVQKDGETIWNPLAHTATIKLKTTQNIPQGSILQYQVNSIEGTWNEYNQTTGITGLSHGNTVYVRIFDGNNETSESSISIEDKIEPEPAEISGLTTTTATGQTITATIIHTDNQSGINLSSCKWIFDTNSGNLGTTNSAWNTATTFNNTSPINITVPNIPGTYYLHVLSVDQAGNKREVTSGAVAVTVNPAKGAKVLQQSNGKTNVEWKETVNGTTKIAKIPVGFSVVKDVGTDVNNITNGLVISDVANDDLDNTARGNQFVWIPVEVDDDGNTPNFVRIEGFESGTRQSDISNFQEAGKEGDTPSTEESRKMYQSVAENGGFYIARFEAGIPNTSSSNGLTPDGNTHPVSKKGVSPWNEIPWGGSIEQEASDGLGGNDNENGAVKVARSMYTKNANCGVTSTLCYGVQWDAVMQFIEPEYKNVPATPEAETVPADSVVRNGTGKGNYGAPIGWKGELAVTGSNPAYQQNHIYDLAGNVYEMTMESSNGEQRVIRGGCYYSAASHDPASNRGYIFTFDLTDTIGFRQALYL